MEPTSSNLSPWPALPFERGKGTYATLHRYLQLVGKVRLAATPWVNHSWHATLYVTAHGLTTGPIYTSRQVFQIDFDFLDQTLELRSNRARTHREPLVAMPVSKFREQLSAGLREFGVDVHVSDVPNEIPSAIPFSKDDAPRVYEPEQAERYFRVLLEIRSRLSLVPHGFPRKGEPRAFVLGQPRSRCHALLGSPRAASPGRCPCVA
ncbi:MAG: DUF5996 family protein [Myxococcales bacterium]